MDKMWWLSQGKLSEIFGSRTIDVDKAMWNFAFEEWALNMTKILPEWNLKFYQAYADGVNE